MLTHSVSTRGGVWFQRLSEEDWKNVLTASLRKSRTAPTIDGDGLVPLGLYTSAMSDDEVAHLITLIQASSSGCAGPRRNGRKSGRNN